MTTSTQSLLAIVISVIITMGSNIDTKIEELYTDLLNGAGDTNKLDNWMDNFSNQIEYCYSIDSSVFKCVETKDEFKKIMEDKYFDTNNLIQKECNVNVDKNNLSADTECQFIFQSTNDNKCTMQSTYEYIDYDTQGEIIVEYYFEESGNIELIECPDESTSLTSEWLTWCAETTETSGRCKYDSQLRIAIRTECTYERAMITEYFDGEYCDDQLLILNLTEISDPDHPCCMTSRLLAEKQLWSKGNYKWFGTAPQCDASCADCMSSGSNFPFCIGYNDHGDGKHCDNGNKYLCVKGKQDCYWSTTDNMMTAKDCYPIDKKKFGWDYDDFYWSGTAPFCGGHKKDCKGDYQYIMKSNSGDGDSCLSGHKVLCARPFCDDDSCYGCDDGGCKVSLSECTDDWPSACQEKEGLYWWSNGRHDDCGVLIDGVHLSCAQLKRNPKNHGK